MLRLPWHTQQSTCIHRIQSARAVKVFLCSCLALQLQQEVGALKSALEEEREALASPDLQPGRARHAADQAVAQLRALREEEAELAVQLKACSAAEEGLLQASAGGRPCEEGGAQPGGCFGRRSN